MPKVPEMARPGREETIMEATQWGLQSSAGQLKSALSRFQPQADSAWTRFPSFFWLRVLVPSEASVHLQQHPATITVQFHDNATSQRETQSLPAAPGNH